MPYFLVENDVVVIVTVMIQEEVMVMVIETPAVVKRPKNVIIVAKKKITHVYYCEKYRKPKWAQGITCNSSTDFSN